MHDRARKTRRVAHLLEQRKLAEEWKLRALQRRLSDCARDQCDLITALNEDHALHGLFLDTTARRLGSLAEEGARLGEAMRAQSTRLLESAGRRAGADRLAAAAGKDARRETDRKALLDLVEQLVGRRDASLP